MKKIILLLLFIPFVCIGQIKDFTSDDDILVYDDGETYNSTKVYYSNRYPSHKDRLVFINANQRVYIKFDRVKEFGELYEKGMNKAIEWFKIAKEKNVPELEKDMEWKFKTNGGMLYDASSFENVAPTDGEFKVRISIGDRGDSNNYRYRVYQTDEYRVYSAFADIGLVILNRDGGLELANKLIDFCKNYETYVNAAIDKFNSKDDLFN
jgi:hypothetical protein